LKFAESFGIQNEKCALIHAEDTCGRRTFVGFSNVCLDWTDQTSFDEGEVVGRKSEKIIKQTKISFKIYNYIFFRQITNVFTEKT
jgi:hypothetical protein